MNIYFLGPTGSFSESAVRKSFSETDTFIAVGSFEEIVAKVKLDKEGIGALVIENSISSSVHQNVDLVFQNEDLHIIGETFMKIQMDIMAVEGASLETIKDVYSYPQALSQCTVFIHEHNLMSHETSSTSEAAKLVAESKDKTKAAIGSSLLAEMHGLHILEKDIANEKHNISRWVFISTKTPVSEQVSKVTYIFKVKHEPGSLVAVLNKLAEKKGNLTKIESRPLPGTNWEYGFWIDVEIPIGTQSQFDTLMKEVTLECRMVGGYTKGSLLI